MKFKKLTIFFVVLLVIAGIFFYISRQKEVALEIVLDGGTYVSEELPVSFGYPNHLSVTTIDDPDGEMVLFSSQEKGGVIQMFVTEGVQGFVITPQILKTDLPDLKNVSMTSVEVNPSTQGVLFAEGNGDIQNLWFAMGDKIYQITFFSEFEEDVVAITNSLRLNK